MKNLKSESGVSSIELAVILPLLVLMLLGTIDFGRVFYGSITVANAARAGVSYGSLDLDRSQQDVIIKGKVLDEAQALGLDSDDVVVEWYCECANGSTVDPCNPSDDSTCSEGEPRVFVKVRAEWTFNTLFDYPGIPDAVTIRREAIMRAQ